MFIVFFYMHPAWREVYLEDTDPYPALVYKGSRLFHLEPSDGADYAYKT